MTDTPRYTLTVDNVPHHDIAEVILTYRSDGDFEKRLTEVRNTLPIGTPASMNVTPGSPEYTKMQEKGICAGGRFLYFSQLAGLQEFEENTVQVKWEQTPSGDMLADVLTVTGFALPAKADNLTRLLVEVLVDQVAARVRELDALRAGALIVLDDLLDDSADEKAPDNNKEV